MPVACIVSPADRAQQTALGLKRKFKTVDDLAPGGGVAAILAAAGWPDARDPVLVVGHQPTLGMIAAFLLSGEEAAWAVRKGAIWWLSNRQRDGGTAVVLRVGAQPRPRLTTAGNPAGGQVEFRSTSLDGFAATNPQVQRVVRRALVNRPRG